jgi:hypothetical protein
MESGHIHLCNEARDLLDSVGFTSAAKHPSPARSGPVPRRSEVRLVKALAEPARQMRDILSDEGCQLTASEIPSR